MLLLRRETAKRGTVDTIGQPGLRLDAHPTPVPLVHWHHPWLQLMVSFGLGKRTPGLEAGLNPASRRVPSIFLVYSGTFVGIDHLNYTHSLKSQLSYFGSKLGFFYSDRLA